MINIRLMLKLGYLWLTKQTPERALADLDKTLNRLEGGMDEFGKIVDETNAEIDKLQIISKEFNAEREKAERVVHNIRVNIFGEHVD